MSKNDNNEKEFAVLLENKLFREDTELLLIPKMAKEKEKFIFITDKEIKKINFNKNISNEEKILNIYNLIQKMIKANIKKITIKKGFEIELARLQTLYRINTNIQDILDTCLDINISIHGHKIILCYINELKLKKNETKIKLIFQYLYDIGYGVLNCLIDIEYNKKLFNNEIEL